MKPHPTAPPYVFAGFSTSYRLWVLPNEELTDNIDFFHPNPSEDLDTLISGPPHDPLKLSSRERISQFLILPPYQGQSHGTHLYNAMTSLFLADPFVLQITIEDPNEAMDELRDYCDLARLRTTNSDFNGLQLPATIPKDRLSHNAIVPLDLLLPPEKLKAIRRVSKIESRQMRRLIEMQLLMRIPVRNRSSARISRKSNAADENDRRFYFWRLLVKERVYRKNVDQLMQVDANERIELVEKQLGPLQEEYERILAGAEKRGAGILGESENANRTEMTNGKGKSMLNGATKRSRKVIEEEDDDDDEKEAGGSAKKVKV